MISRIAAPARHPPCALLEHGEASYDNRDPSRPSVVLNEGNEW